MTTRRQLLRALRKAKDEEKTAPQFATDFIYNLRRPTLFCLWITGFCVSGSINVIALNTTQIYLSISEDPNDKVRPALYVAITSIGNAVGRLAMAFLEVTTQSKPPEVRIPITVFYCVPPTLCIASCVLFLVMPTAGLLAPMLLGGLGNGFYAAAEVLVVRTIFSVDVSKHYSSLFFFEMLAVIFMNRLMFGEIMTKHSVKNEKGTPQCLGRWKCIGVSFVVLTVFGAIGLLSSIIMHISYVMFAKKALIKRRERKEEIERRL